MPSLARKILIVAAVDALVISPIHSSRSKSPPPAAPAGCLRIEYKTQHIGPYTGKKQDTVSHSGVEAHGIVGLLSVSPSNAYLIAITDREQVATIHGRHPVYVITDIALIPVRSRKEAQASISRARAAFAKRHTAGDSSWDTEGTTDDEDAAAAAEDDAEDSIDEVSSSPEPLPNSRISSVGEDVIGRKGAYGRFAEKWFSRRGWAVDSRRAEGMSSAEPVQEAVLNPPRAASPPVANDEDFSKPENRPAPAEDAETKEAEQASLENTAVEAKVDGAVEEAKEDVTHNLTPKLLQTTKLLLAGSRGFYFSYDWDLTRSWITQGSSTHSSSSLPLYKQVDPLFFWNRHLQKPFIEAGHSAYVLPLLQGFVGQRTFFATPSSSSASAEGTPEEEIAATAAAVAAGRPDSRSSEKDVLEEAAERSRDGGKELILTLISRRSTKRPGLRYLRRGVDDHGYTANSVETEQLVSDPAWTHVFSYLQIRGSIPLYFQQSPYSLKPRPVMLLSETANTAAIRLHFKSAKEKYGDIHAVSLVEKDGPEAIVGEKYQHYVDEMAKDGLGIGFSWFDFHKECRGMKFENVARLFTEIGDVLDGFAYTETEESVGRRVVRMQKGVLRTNCMDCLDRTNVVQSAAARRALETQLKSMGIDLKDETTEWFNILWADNGDAISKQYASSAALKGDFTRTRKRTIAGALTDFSFTLTRYFTNIISDFFTQAALDFLLGNVTAQVFSDFEAEMVSGDPAVSMRRIRQNAIEVTSKIVVADESEDLLGGWTFLSPREEGVLRSTPGSSRSGVAGMVKAAGSAGRGAAGGLVEKVLLLTDRAVYVAVFDFAVEKVSAFERVPLEDVVAIRWGTYITSTLAASHTDPRRNVGFVLEYEMSPEKDVVRVNTRSLRNAYRSPPVSPITDVWPVSISQRQQPESEGVQQAEVPKTNTENRRGSSADAGPSPNEHPRKFWAFKMLPLDTASVLEGTDPNGGGDSSSSSPNSASSSTEAGTSATSSALNVNLNLNLSPSSSPNLNPNSTATDANARTEKDLLRGIVEELASACDKARARTRPVNATGVKREASNGATAQEQEGARDGKGENESTSTSTSGVKVEERDIIGLSEARKDTSVLERVGYSLKKLVWA